MEQVVSREGDGAQQALSSREQELRLLVETIPALMWGAGSAGNVEFAAQLQAILNVVPAYTWYAAPSGALIFVNKRTADYLGIPKDDPLRFGIDIGAQWDDWVPLLHPDDREASRKYWSNCLRTGEPGEQSYRVRSGQGDYRWFLSRFEPLRAGDETLVLWVGATLDIEEAKKAEDLLRRSEAHLAEAQRLSHTGAVAYDGRAILFASEETYHIWGFDPAQGLPSREVVFERIHPGDRDWLNAEVRRAVGEKRRFSTAYRILLPDGTVKHLETIGQPVFSASGKLVEIFATQTDVTERKRAEEALRESEAKFRDYAESASDWFWEIAPDYKFTMLTDNAFGSNAADRIGTAWWDHALDLETEPEKWRLIQATLDSRKSFRDFVYRGMGGNGSPIYVKASGKPVFDADGEFRGYRGTAMDVTEQEQLTQELQQREAYLAEAQRLSQTGSWAWSGDQNIRYWSEECYRVLSFDPQDGLPRFEEFFQRIHPEDQPGFRELMQTAIREKAEWQADYRIVHLDGAVRDIHVVGHPVLSTSGHLVEFVGTVIDVTERRRAEQERARLRQLEADLAHINRVSTLGEMAASLAHEVTQPIATVRNNASAALNFLDKKPPDLGEVKEALDCIVNDADRAGAIIDRVRDHSKKAPPRKERFDLNGAIEEVTVLARGEITKNGVSVDTHLTEATLSIEGDRVQLQQVVLNLILNAIEAMGSVQEGPRELSISTEQTQANGVLVAVRDTGPGIDGKHLERVFQPFYTTKSSGVGMGLSISRSIIHDHGGRLWADVNEPRGALFQFTLPIAESQILGSLETAD
jgi:PAS domain S-box-containing protein